MYTLILYDENGVKLGKVRQATNPSTSLSLNQAGETNFQIPASALDVSKMELATNFILYYNRDVVVGGEIANRDLTSNPYSIRGITNEFKLSEMPRVPDNYHYYNGKRVHEVASDLLNEFHLIRFNTENDLTILAESAENLQMITDDNHEHKPMLALAYDGNRHFVPSGRATWVIDVSAYAKTERIRFKQEVGEKTYVTISYQVSYDNQTTWSDWIGPLGQFESSTFPEDEGFYLGFTGATHIRVKIELVTEDTSSPAYSDTELNDDPELEQFYGVTPLFFGLEMICRKPGKVTSGFIAETEETVTDFTIGDISPLQAMIDLATKMGYEFIVTTNSELWFMKTVGKDLSETVKIKSSRNCNITKLSDGLEGIENYIECTGRWSGISQVYAIVKDDQSITDYGFRPGKFSDSGADTVAKLMASGNEYLAKKKEPQPALQVNMPMPRDLHLMPGDIVTVVLASERIKLKTKIVAISTTTNDAGQVLASINLNKPQKSIIDGIIKQAKKVQEVDRKLTETVAKIERVERGINDTPSQPTPPKVTLLYTEDRSPYVKIEWVTVTSNTNGTRAEDIAGYRLIKSKSDNLTSPQILDHPMNYNLEELDYNVKEGETWYYAIQAYDRFNNRSPISLTEDIIIQDTAIPSDIVSIEGRGYLDKVLAIVTYPNPKDPAIEGAEVYYVPHDTIRDGKDAGDPLFPVDVSELVYRGPSTRPFFEATKNGYIYGRTYNTNGVPGENYVVSELVDLTETSTAHVEQYEDGWMLRVVITDQDGNIIGDTGIIVDASGDRLVLDAREVIAPGTIIAEHMAARTITADLYDQLRQTMPVTFADSLDQDNPLIVDFIIPSETISIQSVKLSIKGQPFRAYSTGAEAAGEHNHVVNLPEHTHPITLTDLTMRTGRSLTGLTIKPAGAHPHVKITKTAITLTHAYQGTVGTSTAVAHAHTFADSDSDTINIPDHQHTLPDADFTGTSGGCTKTVSISVSGTTGTAGGHSHQLDGHPVEQIGVSNEDKGEHAHATEEPLNVNPDGTSERGHDHSVVVPVAAESTGNPAQSVQTQVSAGPHAHVLVPGIYLSTTPKDVKIVCSNNGETWNDLDYINAPYNAPDTTTPYQVCKELDLTSEFTLIRDTGGNIANQFKAIKIMSSRLGRVSGLLMVKVDIRA